MTFQNIRGVGGGAGAGSFVELADHVFANAAARDTFYTADPNAATNVLTLVQARTTIILLDDGANNAVTQIWTAATPTVPANYSNTNWESFTSTVPSASLIKTLYESNADTNALDDAKLGVLNVLTVAGSQLVSSLPVVTTPTSLIFGVNGAEVSSAGEAIVFETTSGSDAFVIDNAFTSTGGSATLFRSRLIPRNTYTLQPLKDVTSTHDPEFTYTVQAIGPDQSPALPTEDRRHTDQLTFETADSGDMTVTMRDTDKNGKLLRQQTVAVTVDTETTVDLEKPVCLAVGTQVHVEIGGNIRIKGTTIATVFAPFLKVRSYLGYDDQVMTNATANDFAVAIVSSLGTLTGSNRLPATSIDGLPVVRTDEDIRDVIVAMLQAGTDISLVEDDPNNTLTINFTGSGSFNAPRVDNFAINIPSRVDVGTDLNNARTLTFDLMHSANIQGDLTLEVTTGTNQLVGEPFVDGTNSKSVTLAGISTAAEGTVTFRITGTDTQGGSFASNTVSIEVRTLTQHEFIYYGQSTTNVLASINITTLSSSAEAQTGDVNVSIGPLVANNYIVFASPADHLIQSITNTASGTNEISSYPVAGTQTVGSVQYTVRILDHAIDPLAAGLTFNYRLGVA